VKRIAQLSVLALGALALWMVLPSSESPPPRGRVPSAVPSPDVAAAPSAAQPQKRASAPAPVVPGAAPVVPGAAPVVPEAGPEAAEPGAAPSDEALAMASFRESAPEAFVREPATGDRSTGDDGRVRLRTGEFAAAPPPSGRPFDRPDLPTPDPVQVEQLVEREVPDGSLPPEQLEQARDDARQRIVEEQLLADQLARESMGDNPDEIELQRRRDFARTLLSAQDPATLQRIQDRAADKLPPPVPTPEEAQP